MSKTYQEIKSQYSALRNTFDYMLSKRGDIAAFVQSRSPKSLTFIGCGSSFCLSESAAFSARLRASIPSIALAGGDLMLNAGRYRPLLQDTILIAPSRSGATSEIVEAVRLARAEQDVPLLAIACVSGSPLSGMAELPLELPWAFDDSVCQTRTVTNLYAANLLIAAFLANDERLIADIDTAIRHGDDYLALHEEAIRKASGFAWTNAVVLADGEVHGLATEGAIALTEIARAEAHAHHLLDVRHGPMVTVGPNTLVIAALTEESGNHGWKLMQDIKRRGATIVAYADRPELVPSEVDCVVSTGVKLDAAAQGIPFILIPQLAALASAERQGIDPDQPDGLTAWVKL